MEVRHLCGLKKPMIAKIIFIANVSIRLVCLATILRVAGVIDSKSHFAYESWAQDGHVVKIRRHQLLPAGRHGYVCSPL